MAVYEAPDEKLADLAPQQLEARRRRHWLNAPMLAGTIRKPSLGDAPFQTGRFPRTAVLAGERMYPFHQQLKHKHCEPEEIVFLFPVCPCETDVL